MSGELLAKVVIDKILGMRSGKRIESTLPFRIFVKFAFNIGICCTRHLGVRTVLDLHESFCTDDIDTLDMLYEI